MRNPSAQEFVTLALGIRRSPTPPRRSRLSPSRRALTLIVTAVLVALLATTARAESYEMRIDTSIRPSGRPLVLIDPDEINHELRVESALNANRRVAALKRVPPATSAASLPPKTVFSVNNADTGPLVMEMRADVVPTSGDRLAFLPFNREITEHAKQYQLDPALVHAVITVESAHNPRAVSPKGATGLMQLMPETAARFGVRDRTSPWDNVRSGTAYLRFLVDYFDGNLALAIAGYNAGEHAVMNHGRRIPPYAETQQYVPKVLETYRRLRDYSGATPSNPSQPFAVRVSAQSRTGR